MRLASRSGAATVRGPWNDPPSSAGSIPGLSAHMGTHTTGAVPGWRPSGYQFRTNFAFGDTGPHVTHLFEPFIEGRAHPLQFAPHPGFPGETGRPGATGQVV